MLRASSKLLVVLLLLLAVPFSGITAQDTLTETFTAPDGSYSLHYPAGWVYEFDTTGLILANSTASLGLFTQGSDQVPSGTLVVLKGADPNLMANGQLDPGVDYTPLTLATTYQQLWAQMDTENVIGEPTSMTIGGHEAARMTIANTVQKSEGIFLITDVDDALHVFLAMGSVGDVGAAEPTVQSIVASLETGAAVPMPTAPPPAEAEHIAFGDTVEGEITSVAGQRWTFTGNQGDIVQIAVTTFDIDSLIELFGPDGALVATDDDSGGNLNPLIANFELPASGDYAIVVRAYSGTQGGAYTLALQGSHLAEPGMLAYGDAVVADMIKGTGDRWTFVGAAGDLVTIRMTADFDNYLELHDASGASLRTDDDSGGSGNAAINAYALPADGTYAIIARSYNTTTTGRYSLDLALTELQPPTEVQMGVIVRAVLQTPLGDQWLFEAQQGQTVTIAMVGSFDTVLELYGPDETLVASNDDGEIYSTSVIEDVALPTTGQYRLVARAYSSGLGPYMLMVGLPQDTANSR